MKYTKLFPDTINGIQYTDEEVQNSEELKMEAIKEYGSTIKYIENPTEEMKLDAVKNSGCAIQHINNPSEEMKMKAIKEDYCAIEHIKNPSEKILDYVYYKNKELLKEFYKIED